MIFVHMIILGFVLCIVPNVVFCQDSLCRCWEHVVEQNDHYSYQGTKQLTLCDCPKTWRAARAECTLRGGSLALFTAPNDLSTALAALDTQSDFISGAWIAAKRTVEDWHWVNFDVTLRGQGCWSMGATVFPHRSQHQDLTHDSCVSTCQQMQYPYAGLTNGDTCLCMNAYGASGPGRACTSRCTGRFSSNCGGVDSYFLLAVDGVKSDIWSEEFLRGSLSSDSGLCARLECKYIPEASWSLTPARCSSSNKYLCVFDIKDGICPHGNLIEGRCYDSSFLFKDFYGAKSDCYSKRGHLAEFSTSEQLFSVISAVRSPLKCYYQSLWVAASRINMAWQSETPAGGCDVAFGDWWSSDSDSLATESCVLLRNQPPDSSFKLAVNDCEERRPFICEKGITYNVVTTTTSTTTTPTPTTTSTTTTTTTTTTSTTTTTTTTTPTTSITTTPTTTTTTSTTTTTPPPPPTTTTTRLTTPQTTTTTKPTTTTTTTTTRSTTTSTATTRPATIMTTQSTLSQLTTSFSNFVSSTTRSTSSNSPPVATITDRLTSTTQIWQTTENVTHPQTLKTSSSKFTQEKRWGLALIVIGCSFVLLFLVLVIALMKCNCSWRTWCMRKREGRQPPFVQDPDFSYQHADIPRKILKRNPEHEKSLERYHNLGLKQITEQSENESSSATVESSNHVTPEDGMGNLQDWYKSPSDRSSSGTSRADRTPDSYSKDSMPLTENSNRKGDKEPEVDSLYHTGTRFNLATMPEDGNGFILDDFDDVGYFHPRDYTYA